MIYRIKDLIPSANVGTQIGTGQWVRAMHEPFWPGLISRIHDAVAVLRGPEVAVAVKWPKSGEFEQAIALSEKHVP